METIFAFVAGFLVSPYVLFSLLMLGIILEYAEWTGFAIFVGIIAAISAFLFFDVSLQTLAMASAIYVVIGLGWSFWRYRVYVNKKVNDAIVRKTKLESYEISRWSPKESIGKITAWVLIWPFSMIENIASDVIRFIETLIRDVFNRIYDSIFESAIAKLPPKKEKE